MFLSGVSYSLSFTPGHIYASLIIGQEMRLLEYNVAKTMLNTNDKFLRDTILNGH